jgi:hypothetical protein
MFDKYDLRWDGDELRLLTDHLLATLERDGARPSLWRIRLPNGHLTEAVEQDRARDAAVALALESLALTGLASKPDRPAL